ncbi:hypothetical protein [Methylocapsa palsarum]|uniref:hypothetical protein n=1 Tax=Methylocapsa palsarum TaxID=1612308 RepID=UPI0011138283|nr:hypothetical protein [Methylocapsa palsarum]
MLKPLTLERFLIDRMIHAIGKRYEHIPIGVNQSNRQEYAQAFDSGAISDRPHDFMRSESAPAAKVKRFCEMIFAKPECCGTLRPVRGPYNGVLHVS